MIVKLTGVLPTPQRENDPSESVTNATSFVRIYKSLYFIYFTQALAGGSTDAPTCVGEGTAGLEPDPTPRWILADSQLLLGDGVLRSVKNEEIWRRQFTYIEPCEV